MDIIPIQSLPAVGLTAAAASRAELATARSIEFHPQEQDATYTPSNENEEEQEGGQHRRPKGHEAGPQLQLEVFPDELNQSTISLFA